MEASARVSSKGQITIPRDVREVLGIKQGDTLLFSVNDGRVTISRIPDFFELAGSVPVPVAKRGTPWDEVLRETRRKRAAARR